MNRSKYKALLLIALLPLMLTGCGFIDAVVGFFRMMLITGLIIGNAIWCIINGLRLAEGAIRSKRGTNVVTRFARNGIESYKRKRMFIGGCILIMVDLGLGYVAYGFLGMPIALAPILILVLNLVLLRKDTKDEQRIKDSRVMTKASLDATAQTAGVIGTTAGTLIGGPGAGSAIGGAIGNAASSVAANASANMQVEGAVQIDVSDAANQLAFATQIANPELFMQNASRTGINVQGRTLEQVADEVIKYAPQARLANIDPNKSKAELAMDILAAYNQVKQQAPPPPPPAAPAPQVVVVESAPPPPPAPTVVVESAPPPPAPTVVVEAPQSAPAKSVMPHSTAGGG